MNKRACICHEHRPVCDCEPAANMLIDLHRPEPMPYRAWLVVATIAAVWVVAGITWGGL